MITVIERIQAWKLKPGSSLSFQGRGQIRQPQGQLPLERGVSGGLQMAESPERSLPLQHQVGGVRAGDRERIFFDLLDRRGLSGFQNLKNLI